MARRSTRKVRHRPDAPTVFTFKQRTQMGQITKKIEAKEITLEEIQNDPKTSWMIEVWQKIKNQALEQIEQEMVELPSEYPAQFNEPTTSEVDGYQ